LPEKCFVKLETDIRASFAIGKEQEVIELTAYRMQ